MDIKPVTTEHPKASHKLSKSIRQAKKVSQVGYDQTSNSLLYNDAKKWKSFRYKNNEMIWHF